jgi:hypothetical protein
MIPVKRLLSGATIDLEMSDDPAAELGPLFFGSSDGFILSAELVPATRLKGAIEAATGHATTKIRSRAKPAKVKVNDKENAPWSYDEARQTITIQTTDTSTIEVWAR